MTIEQLQKLRKDFITSEGYAPTKMYVSQKGFDELVGDENFFEIDKPATYQGPGQGLVADVEIFVKADLADSDWLLG